MAMTPSNVAPGSNRREVVIAAAADLFDDKDKYKVFARKIWPLLTSCREEIGRMLRARDARYKGFAKVDLQNQLIAAACNIKRWFRKLLGTFFATQTQRSSSTICSLARFG